MSAAIVLCSWFAAEGRTARARALSVAALPPVLLALWMTDSRGGLVAAALAFVVLLLAGRGRSRLIANLVIGALAAIGITITAEELFDFSLLDEVYAENPDLIVG